jgi:single-stranded DNA-binding protein
MSVINDLNSVILEGNLIRDPIRRFDDDEGEDVCDLAVASNFYPDEQEREVSFFAVRVYSKRKIASVENQGRKGGRVRITGRLKQECRGGIGGDSAPSKSVVVIVAETVEFHPVK